MSRDWTNFDEFLWESFCEGQSQRELRLSQEELGRLQARYPLSAWEPTSMERDGRCWYLIHPARPAASRFLPN